MTIQNEGPRIHVPNNPSPKPMAPISRKAQIILAIILVLLDFLFFYVTLPALNLQNIGFWFCLLVLFAEAVFVLSLRPQAKKGGKFSVYKILTLILVVGVVVLIFGGIFSSPIFSASKYASLMQPEERVFEEDIPQSDTVSNIALMDTNSARIIGSRAVGSLADIVSQFEVSESYTTIDLNGKPMKVASLEYADFFKYLNNKSEGIPGYVMVDPVNNEAQYVKLTDKIQYTSSAYFGKNLFRHLRFRYPTSIFQGTYLELNDEGHPYYVCPVLKANVGLFGAMDVKGIILLDPVSGDTEYYKVSDVPQWVDRVYDGDLLTQKYDWYGTLSNGFLNSMFGNVGCRKTTSDYGYKVMDGDVWVYTGVTSVNSDESNIGFVMMNSRTSECRYYQVAGAEEYSAMSSAEGQVQHLGYSASFPSLINVEGQPTYIMVLKDHGGLVKLYAMVNVQKYNIVTTGASQREVMTEYRKALKDNGISSSAVSADMTAEFTVKEIRYITIEGDTWVYITAEDGIIYKQLFSEDETLIYLNSGDTIQAAYEEADNSIRTILSRLA